MQPQTGNWNSGRYLKLERNRIYSHCNNSDLGQDYHYVFVICNNSVLGHDYHYLLMCTKILHSRK